MKDWVIPRLACPHCRGSLTLADAQFTAGEVETGQSICATCRATYPITGFIPRFVPRENYAGSFGFQWNRFSRTQLDSYTGTTISRDRFLEATGWHPGALQNAVVLDAGCGAGRFAEVALSLGAKVIAVDYSEAVDACRRNLGSHPNIQVLQGDIYNLPLRNESFDLIYSLGVLQHTPDPRKAVLSLPPLLRNGGQLAVDIYPRSWSSFAHAKYWLRPVTVRLSRLTLFRMVERAVPALLSVSNAFASVPGIGRMFQRLVPVANYAGILPLNREQLREWAVLDTFDWFSPAYDNPQTPGTFRSWLEEAGLENICVARVGHLAGRGRKPGTRGVGTCGSA